LCPSEPSAAAGPTEQFGWVGSLGDVLSETIVFSKVAVPSLMPTPPPPPRLPESFKAIVLPVTTTLLAALP
jgi:hypothetical protein